ncbi:TraR/DksA C4-type zinc finger protein [Aureibacillus halotolerans]|uniref:TraR/DksA family transcriptional regulator n=1 Tax=Aureibacillus halotolerans TaxID=1508390 RepID=A0A4R6U2U2_9BACI|nr:TraR/DksA C4-type zinc finger protein [Aureibacillus halotolerans]TDQ40311.1 TraR/DksA family transcriptional regulator [Aureibacillus halotolerans]
MSHLTDSQRNTLKQQLLEIKNAVENRQDKSGVKDQSLAESYGDVPASADNHAADMATELYDREKAIALAQHDEGILDDVNEALQRLEDGTYGYCKETNEPIPVDRLMAMPFALRTVEAQEKVEKQSQPATSQETEKAGLYDPRNETIDRLEQEQDAYQDRPTDDEEGKIDFPSSTKE